jgi:hypothetical protein
MFWTLGQVSERAGNRFNFLPNETRRRRPRMHRCDRGQPNRRPGTKSTITGGSAAVAVMPRRISVVTC